VQGAHRRRTGDAGGAQRLPVLESERQQGYTLLCAHSAASETLVLETLEAVGPADILPQEQVVKVKAIAPLAPDTLHLQLQTSRGSRLRFLAGQSVTLGLAEEGSDVAAAYPVASCPCDDRNLSFHVPRRDGDAFALWLFAGAIRVGEALNCAVRPATSRWPMPSVRWRSSPATPVSHRSAA
jgi:CDP-4-dehydro-6-deoxyglucose reductase